MTGIARLLIVFAIFCGGTVAAADLPLRYGDRVVDLKPYYFAFPYNIEEISLADGKVFISRREETGRTSLYVVDWTPGELVDVSGGLRPVTTADLSRISFWGRVYSSRLGGIVASADEDKSEQTSLYLFKEGNDRPIRLTDVEYVYAMHQTDDGSAIYFLSRYGESDHAEGCLERLTVSEDGATAVDVLLCDSSPAMPARMSWWSSIHVSNGQVIFTALDDGDRDRQELYAYSLTDGSVRLLRREHGANWAGAIDMWQEDGAFLFVRDRALFRYRLSDDSVSEVYRLKTKINRVHVLNVGAEQFLTVTEESEAGTRLDVLRWAGDRFERTDTLSMDASVRPRQNEDDRLFLWLYSARYPVDFRAVRVDAEGKLHVSPLVEGLQAINDTLGTCRVEPVSFTYTDGFGGGAQTVEVGGYLYTPRDPIAEADRLYVVQAFYGGRNSFTRGFQALCAVGITTYSPTVRGDSRFSPEHEKANDGRKADAPVRDTIAAARYLKERFAIDTPRRVGTYGFSHGGWAAVRALSIPDEPRFDFGFAIAGAGYFDFIEIADRTEIGETNIHGWIEKEFGDMETEREWLAEISPARHVGSLAAPIFLFHGENDRRITAKHTQHFAALLEEAGKPHDIYVVPEQGHGIDGAENWHAIYSRMFHFLDRVRQEFR